MAVKEIVVTRQEMKNADENTRRVIHWSYVDDAGKTTRRDGFFSDGTWEEFDKENYALLCLVVGNTPDSPRVTSMLLGEESPRQAWQQDQESLKLIDKFNRRAAITAATSSGYLPPDKIVHERPEDFEMPAWAPVPIPEKRS